MTLRYRALRTEKRGERRGATLLDDLVEAETEHGCERLHGRVTVDERRDDPAAVFFSILQAIRLGERDLLRLLARTDEVDRIDGW
jgi:hypothetical protein